jgi:hypothetical protein
MVFMVLVGGLVVPPVKPSKLQDTKGSEDPTLFKDALPSALDYNNLIFITGALQFAAILFDIYTFQSVWGSADWKLIGRCILVVKVI